MKIDNYIFVETFPNQFNGDNAFPEKEKLEPGKVYFCKEYSSSVHLCPCGCGEAVYIPFKEQNVPHAFWGLKDNSFTPSIHKKFGCQSHYFIQNGKVQWA